MKTMLIMKNLNTQEITKHYIKKVNLNKYINTVKDGRPGFISVPVTVLRENPIFSIDRPTRMQRLIQVLSKNYIHDFRDIVSVDTKKTINNKNIIAYKLTV